MACFLVPTTVAIVTTVVRKVVQKKERGSAAPQADRPATKVSGKWTQRLGWLNTMLWGGAALLCLEHIWHGEVVPWPPFLTAMQTPGDVGPMLHEMATYGSAMTIAVALTWGIMVAVVEMRSRSNRLGEMKSNAADGGA